MRSIHTCLSGHVLAVCPVYPLKDVPRLSLKIYVIIFIHLIYIYVIMRKDQRYTEIVAALAGRIRYIPIPAIAPRASPS